MTKKACELEQEHKGNISWALTCFIGGATWTLIEALLCWWTDIGVFDSWTSSEGSGIVDDSQLWCHGIHWWGLLILSIFWFKCSNNVGWGGCHSQWFGWGDVMVGDPGEGLSSLVIWVRGMSWLVIWVRGVSQSVIGQGDVMVSDWGMHRHPWNRHDLESGQWWWAFKSEEAALWLKLKLWCFSNDKCIWRCKYPFCYHLESSVLNLQILDTGRPSLSSSDKGGRIPVHFLNV